MKYAEYREQMVRRFLDYATDSLANHTECLEQNPLRTRPPVFVDEASWRNVLTRPGASQEDMQTVLSAVPKGARHRWFRSMSSSQALTLSVFGNLKYYDKIGLLGGLCCELGRPIFCEEDLSPDQLRLEYEVRHLGEPRPTSIDVLVEGRKPVAIECKLTEREVGGCSRPRLTQKASSYSAQYCDGNYRPQMGRQERCPLTERGILYWRHLPNLFNLDSGKDHLPCPLRLGYQLARNILAVGARDLGLHSSASACAVLLYDARNPEFQPGGAALQAFEEVSSLLKDKEMLRKCSWQALVGHLRLNGLMPWLSDGLRAKYGF